MALTPRLNFDSNFLLFAVIGRIVVPRQVRQSAIVVREPAPRIAPVSDPGIG
jgi:hypothetical protein